MIIMMMMRMMMQVSIHNYSCGSCSSVIASHYLLLKKEKRCVFSATRLEAAATLLGPSSIFSCGLS